MPGRKSQSSAAKAFTAVNRGPRVIDWASPEQGEAFAHGPSPLLLTGGYGSGKTHGLATKIAYLSTRFPKNRGVVVRRVYEDLKRTTMPTFFNVIPPEMYSNGGKRADSERHLQLNNGSEILWMYLDHPSSASVLGGLEINWFFLNQAEEIEEEMFDKLMGRLGRWQSAEVPPDLLASEAAAGRPWQWWSEDKKRPLVPTYAMLDCNPDTEFHWLYRRFSTDSKEHFEKKHRDPYDYDSDSPKRVSYHDLGYHEITMDSRSNKFLPPQNKSQLMQGGEDFIHRFVKGKWGIPSGTIHNVSTLSIVEGTPEILDWIQRHCTLHRILDHGDSAPTCCLWAATDDSGNVIFYREYYMPNALISDHRQAITSLSVGEKYVYKLADPQIFIKTMQRVSGRYSVADEYDDRIGYPRHTALDWTAADNDELGTRNRISEYLRINPERIHPFTKQRGAPHIFFIKRNDNYPHGCDNAILETRLQRREKIGASLGQTRYSDKRDEKIPDHAYDCVRYFIASRPPLFAAAKPRISDQSFAAIQRRTKQWIRGGGPDHEAAVVAELIRRGRL